MIFDVRFWLFDSISHPQGTQVLLDGIRNDLTRSGLKFERSYVEILPGKDEAEFSWITVNTLLHHLGPNDTLVQRTTNSSTGELSQRRFKVPSARFNLESEFCEFIQQYCSGFSGIRAPGLKLKDLS